MHVLNAPPGHAVLEGTWKRAAPRNGRHTFLKTDLESGDHLLTWFAPDAAMGIDEASGEEYCVPTGWMITRLKDMADVIATCQVPTESRVPPMDNWLVPWFADDVCDMEVSFAQPIPEVPHTEAAPEASPVPEARTRKPRKSPTPEPADVPSSSAYRRVEPRARLKLPKQQHDDDEEEE